VENTVSFWITAKQNRERTRRSTGVPSSARLTLMWPAKAIAIYGDMIYGLVREQKPRSRARPPVDRRAPSCILAPDAGAYRSSAVALDATNSVKR
jgi:hypothetical protein